MTRIQMKPCPFCGSTATYAVARAPEGIVQHYTQCKECRVETPPFSAPELSNDFWNRRAAQPAASAEPRWIGHIMLDAKGQPYARLRTGCDEHGNRWQDMTPFYAAPVATQPSVPGAREWMQARGRDDAMFTDGWNACREAMLKGQK